MPLAFVLNQRRLRLNNAKVRMLIPRRIREGRAQGNTNDRYGKFNDLKFLCFWLNPRCKE
jgi:hypothetical protein